jgi:O-antigen ligase
MIAALAGLAAALLQSAGALKTAPPLAALPVDITLLALAALLPLLGLLLATRRLLLGPALAMPFAAAGLFWLWMVVAGVWSASDQVLAAKLPELVLLGPLMLAAGLLVGADGVALRALAGTSLVIGVALAVLVAAGAAAGIGPWLGVAAAEARVHYQLAGLAMATAASLAAVRAIESAGLPRLAWLALVAALAVAALLPGGRTALLALGTGVILAPAIRLWLDGRRGAGLVWAAAAAIVALTGMAALLLDPTRAEGLRTLERLTGDPAGLEARAYLWAAALEWAGRTAPFGLGTGGFSIAAGFGEWRGRYPHNHPLEALAEAGLPGLLLWLLCFGGAVILALRHAPARGGAAAARLAALTLPIGFTLLVSTDLGNRMAWFALGLLLSVAAASRPLPAQASSHV